MSSLVLPLLMHECLVTIAPTPWSPAVVALEQDPVFPESLHPRSIVGLAVPRKFSRLSSFLDEPLLPIGAPWRRPQTMPLASMSSLPKCSSPPSYVLLAIPVLPTGWD